MAAKKIYKTWQALETAFKAQDLKHAKLIDIDNNDLVSYNVAMNKTKTVKNTLPAKLNEIKRKLTVAEDGMYIVLGVHRFGKNISPMKFYFSKNYTGSLEEVETPKTPAANNPGNSLLSIDNAMANVKDAAYFKSENLFLNRENQDLKLKLAAAEAKILKLEDEKDNLQDALDELDTEDLGEDTGGGFLGLGSFLKEASPMFVPIAEKLLSLSERKQAFAETKFLAENGYEIKGLRKLNGSSKTSTKAREIPEPGAEGWDEFIDYMSNLSDAEFNRSMKKLETEFPEIYEAAYKELYADDEEEEEKEES